MAPSTPLPIPSRTVIGGISGKIRNGPGGNPHLPSVWPKSTLVLKSPNSCLAMSKSPPMPRVLLIRKRPSSAKKPFQFHCRMLFTSFGTTRMLSKPLPDHLLEHVGHEEVVALGATGLSEVLVEVVVEREHLLVELLPGVLLLDLLEVGLRLGGAGFWGGLVLRRRFLGIGGAIRGNDPEGIGSNATGTKPWSIGSPRPRRRRRRDVGRRAVLGGGRGSCQVLDLACSGQTRIQWGRSPATAVLEYPGGDRAQLRALRSALHPPSASARTANSRPADRRSHVERTITSSGIPGVEHCGPFRAPLRSPDPPPTFSRPGLYGQLDVRSQRRRLRERLRRRQRSIEAACSALSRHGSAGCPREVMGLRDTPPRRSL